MMKEQKLSRQSKRELVEAVRDRYLRAGRKEKSKILDEFVATTGFHRKHAIRVLRQGYQRGKERRGRRRTYGGAVISALIEIWRICGCICSKRLQPFLPEMVHILERHGELTLDDETKRLLMQMSAATIDRRLAPFRQQRGRGISTTKPGTLLKQSIPIRTFADWKETEPGFVEMDLVAHCGDANEGVYLNTLTAVDVMTGWTECFLLRHRSQQVVTAAVESLQGRLPFPLLGIDCDNDSMFINGTLKRHCEAEQLTFTRSRPYRKNDQAFVEQKNGDIVRGNIGYRRYTSAPAAALLEAIYEDLHAYVNFFQPVRKLIHKERQGAKVYKQYDEARTPHQRAMLLESVDRRHKLRMQHEYLRLNPAELRRRIDANLKQLWRLPE
ncbi:MAG: transposase family protein [Candidatus Promineifilaceae bacterium]|jgi:hypothetical protein